MVGLPLVWVGNKSPANIVHAAAATDQLNMHLYIYSSSLKVVYEICSIRGCSSYLYRGCLLGLLLRWYFFVLFTPGLLTALFSEPP